MFDTHRNVTHLDDYGDDYIPYVNTGLLLGLKRSGEKSEGDDDSVGEWGGSLSQKWEKITEGFDDGWAVEMAEMLKRDFLELNSVPELQPRCAPAFLGGLGLCGEWDEYDYEAAARVLMFGGKPRQGKKDTHYSVMLEGLGRKFGTIHSDTRFVAGDVMWEEFGREGFNDTPSGDPNEYWAELMSRPRTAWLGSWKATYEHLLSDYTRPKKSRPAVEFVSPRSMWKVEWDVLGLNYTPSFADHGRLPPEDPWFVTPERGHSIYMHEIAPHNN
jgi:hypothetical protein